MASKRKRGNTWHYVVKRKGKIKPLYLTFDSEQEGDEYVAKLEKTLDAGIVPAELVSKAKDETISTASDEYRAAVHVPASDCALLDVLAGRVGDVKLSALTYPWAESFVAGMKRENGLSPSTIRHYINQAFCLAPKNGVALSQHTKQQRLFGHIDLCESWVTLADAVRVVDQVRQLDGLGFRACLGGVFAVFGLSVCAKAVVRHAHVRQHFHQFRNLRTEFLLDQLKRYSGIFYGIVQPGGGQHFRRMRNAAHNLNHGGGVIDVGLPRVFSDVVRRVVCGGGEYTGLFD